MEITVNKPNRPVGAKVTIPGLGEFENGNTYEVDDARWERSGLTNPVFGEPLTNDPPVVPTWNPASADLLDSNTEEA